MAHVSLVAPEGTGPTVVAVDGELDFATVPRLLHRLQAIGGDVELDCSRLTFLDCNGLDALIGAHRGCEARGNRLTVRGLSGVCLRVVRMARADSLLHLVPSTAHGAALDLEEPERGLALVRTADPFAADLARARAIINKESGLATFITLRADGAAHATVVNAGVITHPVTGDEVVGVVVLGGARKLANLRARPRASVLFRSEWDWVTVEGIAELCGPDDDHPELSDDDARALVRRIYAAAVGGTEEDWAALDESFEAEKHTSVLIFPTRTYSSPIDEATP